MLLSQLSNRQQISHSAWLSITIIPPARGRVRTTPRTASLLQCFLIGFGHETQPQVPDQHRGSCKEPIPPESGDDHHRKTTHHLTDPSSTSVCAQEKALVRRMKVVQESLIRSARSLNYGEPAYLTTWRPKHAIGPPFLRCAFMRCPSHARTAQGGIQVKESHVRCRRGG